MHSIIIRWSFFGCLSILCSTIFNKFIFNWVYQYIGSSPTVTSTSGLLFNFHSNFHYYPKFLSHKSKCSKHIFYDSFLNIKVQFPEMRSEGKKKILSNAVFVITTCLLTVFVSLVIFSNVIILHRCIEIGSFSQIYDYRIAYQL